MKYTLRLAWEFILRFRGILIIGVALGIVFFLALNFVAPLFFAKEAEKIGITGRYTPDSLPTIVLADIGDGLTKLDTSGAPKAGLASAWESQDNGKTWIFHLDRDKKWQDGSKVTADTIKYNFQDVAIKTTDPYTLIFNLKAPFSPFPVVVSRPTFKKGLLGTGKWKVSRLSLIGGIVDRIDLNDNEGNRKTYKFYPTEEGVKLAFKLGEVNKLYDLINPAPFDAWTKTVKLNKELNKGRFVAVFFNMQDKLLSDKSVRQALSYAIDKSKLGTDRALGPISPDSWAYNPQIKNYDFDPQRAKEIMNSLAKDKKAELNITLSTPPTLLDQAELIQKDWGKIGVKTRIQVVSTKPDDYQAFLIIHDIPSDPDQYTMWHSTQDATNLSKYKSARIDKLLEDGRIELDQDNRKKIYLDFQRFLLEDAPAAFLYHPISYSISRK